MKLNKLIFYSVIFGLQLLSVRSFADILFLDLNNSPKEVEAAQKAASKRGERLIVLPQMAEAQKAQVARAQSTLRQAEARATRACNNNNYNTQACGDADRAAAAAGNEYMKLMPQFKKENLKAQLAELAKNKVNLTSLIISGHDGNGHFGGSQGTLGDREIKEAFDSVSPLGNNIRSLLLWGCYTTNIGSLEKNWKDVLPSLSMIAGFDGSAPAGDKPANWAYLEDILVKEKSLTAAADQKTLLEIFKGIRGINVMATSVCINKDSLLTPRGIQSIQKSLEKCKSMQSGNLTERLQCYEKAEPNCQDVPANTASGPLRSLYNEIQSSKHCRELVPPSIQLPSGDAALRLMFDKQVRKNFESKNQEGLQTLNRLLKEQKFPEDLQFKDLDKMSRRQFLDKIIGVQKQIDQRSDVIKDEQGRIDDPQLLALKAALDPVKQLSEVSRSGVFCVPFEWVEPNARLADGCGWSKRMQQAPEAGLRGAIVVRNERSDEAAEIQVLGPSYGEVLKKYSTAKKRFQETIELPNGDEQHRKAREELYNTESKMDEMRHSALKTIAQNRINFYKEKASSASNSPMEKTIYEERLSYWNSVASRPNSNSSVITPAGGSGPGNGGIGFSPYGFGMPPLLPTGR